MIYISKLIKQKEVSQEQAKEALNLALAQEGKDYEWGGRGNKVFDCSGLITWSYKQVLKKSKVFSVRSGRSNDATMNDLLKWNVRMLSLKEIRSGDIVFITNEEMKATHVGLFIRWVEDNVFEFINSSSYYDKVTIDAWPVVGMKREQWFVGAGRLKVWI